MKREERQKWKKKNEKNLPFFLNDPAIKLSSKSLIKFCKEKRTFSIKKTSNVHFNENKPEVIAQL